MISSAVSINLKDYIPEYTEEVRQYLALGLRTIAVQMAGNAVDLCPVDTGHLRGSIRGKAYDHKKVVVGSPVEYAPYVEFGDNYTHAVGQAHFLRDSIVKHKEQYKNTLIAALGALK